MTSDHPDEDLMTRRQVAFLFRVTSQAVVRLARRGRLTEVRNSDGTPRYRRAEVEELFRNSFTGESPGTGPGPAGEQAERKEIPPLEPAGDMARDGVFGSGPLRCPPRRPRLTRGFPRAGISPIPACSAGPAAPRLSPGARPGRRPSPNVA